MCGIAGFSGQGTGEALRAAVGALAHRGPDDHGLYENAKNRVGLGHTRLSILDLSPQGHQPMLDPNARAALVYNGEIYNFRDLKAELQATGCRFVTESDTEVLLHAYLVYGEAMLRRLIGIFAFALWDAMRQELLVVRDALGVKPLYYAASEGSFVFASELKALRYLSPKLEELDPVALDSYLSFLWCPGERTPICGVYRLPPGEAIWVKEGRITRKFSWYTARCRSKDESPVDRSVALRDTVALLRRAVQMQMVADVPVGAFLSGGLDSSSVVAFARELNPKIQCYTIECVGGNEEGTTDDLPYARRVAAHLGVQLHVMRVDAASMARDLERMVVQLDEPIADPASLNVLYISRLAREHGIKVLLSGAGGDDLLTGYRRHRALQAERYWSWLPRRAREQLHRAAVALDQRRPMFRRLAKVFSGAGLDDDERLVNYFRWSPKDQVWALYTPEMRARVVAGAQANQPMLEFLAAIPKKTERLQKMLALEQRFFLADHNLLYTDKMSMATGVEVRVPFLDTEFVEFANRLPIGLKQVGREGKWILKKAMEPFLPRDVIYRPKTGFGAPLRRWVRGDLRGALHDKLSESSLRRRGIFDPVAVHRLMQANEAGQVDASYTLLSLFCIETWCRNFIDVRPTT